ncbi:DUF547 domain-containing protein [Aequorivita xiaoshiensis]|uniref:DUF547 domain-containing protein n=1 Tax=Aequorivita xiaoshiensis TaxID=2874476 RepID=A0A9X1R1Z9_9FLAO|nr:DUF547 domain-containing protein [Aequorivita xiaoshiensis]MCG2432033.1 DUF547 domain-containing protein [Aequorivita xiaoshiensis]
MKNLPSFTSILFLLFSLHSCATFSSVDFDNQHIIDGNSDLSLGNSSSKKVNHNTWNELLKKHVQANGLVDYNEFIKDEAKLSNYLKMLSLNHPDSTWNRREVLAYYINLYNAATIKLIIENYPVKSIKDISRPWSKNRILIGGEMISLNTIEHGILRKMNEPRIHFALNCASISCPKLSNEAFTAHKIEQQLERVTNDFINSKENNISISEAKISSIFKWYKKDFLVYEKKDLIGFINQYSKVKINSNTRISYLDYDWSLNEKI